MQESRLAVEIEIAHRAGVGAALAFFQLVDDLHRADLRRTGHRSRREGGAHHIVGGAASGERAGDMRDDVHHVAEALNGREIAALSRCRTRRCGPRRCGRGRRA